MKILQLTNKVPYPPRDGGAIASLTLARELTRAGHQVTVLAMNTSKHFLDTDNPSALIPGLKMEIVSVDTRIRWTHAIINLLFSRLPYNAVRFISEDYRSKLKELLTAADFDFVILDQVYTALYMDDIRASSKAPIVLRAHNIEHEIWSRSAKSSTGLKRLYLTILASRIRKFELSLINRYDAIVPITDRDATHFNQFGNTKPCHVMPAGMDLRDEQPENPAAADKEDNETITVAHLGALDWLPNQTGMHWFVEQVWPIVRTRINNIEFHLAGRNAPPGYKEVIKSPGVFFYGEIEDAADFIANHRIFIVPLFSGSGMRIKLLDYMAAGKATVTTTIGAEGIPVTHGKEAFIADQPEEFANYIVALAGDPGLCTRMGEHAREFIGKNFDNKLLISQLTDFLKTIDHRS